jgi:hypothetical protein
MAFEEKKPQTVHEIIAPLTGVSSPIVPVVHTYVFFLHHASIMSTGKEAIKDRFIIPNSNWSWQVD